MTKYELNATIMRRIKPILYSTRLTVEYAAHPVEYATIMRLGFRRRIKFNLSRLKFKCSLCVWYCSLHVSIVVVEDAKLCANIYHKERQGWVRIKTVVVSKALEFITAIV